jgi:hypothetical protein
MGTIFFQVATLLEGQFRHSTESTWNHLGHHLHTYIHTHATHTHTCLFTKCEPWPIGLHSNVLSRLSYLDLFGAFHSDTNWFVSFISLVSVWLFHNSNTNFLTSLVHSIQTGTGFAHFMALVSVWLRMVCVEPAFWSLREEGRTKMWKDGVGGGGMKNYTKDYCRINN